MKIIFSIYREDFDTWEDTFLFSKTVVTDLTLTEVDDFLQLYQGFHSVLEAGQYFVFWDIYCISVDPEELLKQIERIPTSDSVGEVSKTPALLAFEEFDPGEPPHPLYPDVKRCFAYRLNRFECGASSAHALVVWASDHPWLMIFIGGLIWDIAKYIGAKILSWIRFLLYREKKYCRPRRNVRIVCFSPKAFYKYFSQMTHIAPPDCQIIFLKKITDRNFLVLVRTISRDCYLVECRRNGKISAFELVDDTTANRISWS